MAAYRSEECRACTTEPVMRCGRCTITRCAAHTLAAGRRCDRCECEWAADAAVRCAAKVIFAPPAGILSGGMLFVLLLPVSIGGAIGAAVMAALACGTAVAAGTAACHLVDRSARAMFLRERAGDLPPARLLASPRHR
jgi:hypothetical protein